MKMKLLNIRKKTILLVSVVSIVIVSLSSCEKDFGDINKSWGKKVYDPTIPALYNGIVASLMDGYGSFLTSWIYQNTQLAGMYAASGYRMDNSSGAYWNSYYNALANSGKLLDLIEANPDVAKMTNVKAMVKTLIAYRTLQTTMIHGDMPYSEGGKAFSSADYFRPKYDPQANIIKAALADLKWAVDNFTTSTTQISLGGGETLLANDIAKWIKFANSLRLRYAMVLNVKDAASANTAITEALAKPLLAPNEVVGLYPAAIPNLVIDRAGWYRGNSYVRMGSTMWNAMSSTNAIDGSGIYDLRCKIFFEPNKAGEWTPYPQAPLASTPPEIGNSAGNDPYDNSRINNWVVSGNYLYAPLNFYYVADKTFPQLIITGPEISFLKAEIYNKGISGIAANQTTAKTNYEEGITASVKFWYNLANTSSIWVVNKPAATPTPSELTAMLTNPGVAYSATASTALAQIYKQHWIALFHQPMEGWTLARRTNYATPGVTLATSSPGYNVFRIIYPQSEIDGNYDNWKSVTGGTDSPNIKPWFMP
jgi:hypothetical protein